jgi:1-acyl-sn-glycerol-3-phosphate acyltransferase
MSEARQQTRTLEGLYTYLEFATCALAWLPLLATSTIVHRHDDVPRHRGRWMRRFGRATSALTPLWDFAIEGEKPVDIDTRAYVVVANHASTADPFLLSWLPWDMQWVAKDELFKLPILGTLLRLGGDVPLRRGEGESVREMLSACRHALRHGLSIMMFPEGTRSPDGGVRLFKDGAFRLAIEEGAPILPIAIAGTHRCMPKGSPWFGRARAVARILEPIATAGLTMDDLARVRDESRARIDEAVRELEAALEPEALAGAKAPSLFASSNPT